MCKWSGRRDVGVWCETWVWMLDGTWLAENEDWTCKLMEMSSTTGLEAYETIGAELAGACIGACVRKVWARWPCWLGRRASRHRGGWEVWYAGW